MAFINRSFFLVIPTYNRSALLLRAIQSVIVAFENYLLMAQGTLEIVIVDDGSTDNTHSFISGLCKASRNIELHYLYQNNRGAYAARNHGLEYVLSKTKGDSFFEYLIFLDSDDVLSPFFFTAFLKYEMPKTVFAYEETSFDNSIPKFTGREDDRYSLKRFAKKGCVREILRRTRGVVNTIYPLECWRDVRFPPTIFYEDVAAAAFACFRADKMLFLPIVGYGICTNNVSVVRRKIDDNYCRERIFSAITLWKSSQRVPGGASNALRSFAMGVALHFLILLSPDGYEKTCNDTKDFFIRKKVFLSGFWRMRSLAKAILFCTIGRRSYYSMLSKRKAFIDRKK